MLKKLEDEYQDKRIQVIDAIIQTIKGVGQNPDITEIGNHRGKAYTIKSSALFNSPWSPAFHDWITQADLLIGLLLKKPVDSWIILVRGWAKENKSGRAWKAVIVDKVQLNKEFLQKVVERFK